MEPAQIPAKQPQPSTPDQEPISLAGRFGMGMFLLAVILFVVFLVGEFVAGLLR